MVQSTKTGKGGVYVDLEQLRGKIENLIKRNQSAPFWELGACDFEAALFEFLEFKNIDIPQSDIKAGAPVVEKELLGEKIVREITINRLMTFKMSARKERNWEFSFEGVPEQPAAATAVSKIQKENIVNVNGKDCVMVGYECGPSGLKLYAVPADVAEKIALTAYDGAELHNSTEHEIIDKIRNYEIKNFISFYNPD